MKRCRECAGEVYGSDPVCTGCRTTEWLDMHNPARAREVFNQVQENRKKRYLSGLWDGIVMCILTLLFLAFLANIPDALRYEDKKMEILRANGVK
jgi:hypothetical protein